MTQEALRMALEALITASGHLNNEAFVKVMMARDAVVEALAQPEQEPFAWGVDWGKAGDIACVSIIKRLPNDVIEVVAVEYAPYSYTHSPQRERVLFPTMLRKMWSGGEVQQWLDENVNKEKNT